jgi:hypothetical protein
LPFTALLANAAAAAFSLPGRFMPADNNARISDATVPACAYKTGVATRFHTKIKKATGSRCLITSN